PLGPLHVCHTRAGNPSPYAGWRHGRHRCAARITLPSTSRATLVASGSRGASPIRLQALGTPRLTRLDRLGRVPATTHSHHRRSICMAAPDRPEDLDRFQRVLAHYANEIVDILTDDTRPAEQRIAATLVYLREEGLYEEPPFDFDACFEE